MHACQIAALLTVLALFTPITGNGGANFVESFRALPPQDRVATLTDLSKWSLLQQLAVAADPSGPATELLLQVKQKLQARLPSLEAAAGGGTEDPAALERLATEALSADLAPRPPSRLKRALTLVNIAWFVGCLLVVLAASSLVGVYVVALAMLVPLWAWEALGYAASAAIIWAAGRCQEGTAPFVALTGLLVFTACAGGTCYLHLADWCRQREERAASLLTAAFALVYGAVAIRLQASLLGTLAVWWAVSALGFSIAVFPFLTVIGFRNGMARPFGASLTLILLFLPFKAGVPVPAALRPFETGVWLWCVLVCNVANLILAHRRWDGFPQGIPPEVLAQLPLRLKLRLLARGLTKYLWGQVPALAVIGGTLACGIMLDVEQCRAVGSVFGFLWLCSKLAECNWRRVGIAWGALILGSLLWGSAYAVHTWPRMFGLKAEAA